MLKYKHIEASRELRLWVAQIIIPTLSIGAIAYGNNEQFRKAVDKKIENIKNKFKK